jgi:hypothetical protein
MGLQKTQQQLGLLMVPNVFELPDWREVKPQVNSLDCFNMWCFHNFSMSFAVEFV